MASALAHARGRHRPGLLPSSAFWSDDKFQLVRWAVYPTALLGGAAAASLGAGLVGQALLAIALSQLVLGAIERHVKKEVRRRQSTRALFPAEPLDP